LIVVVAVARGVATVVGVGVVVVLVGAATTVPLVPAALPEAPSSPFLSQPTTANTAATPAIRTA
jgi:hypothetical protein